MCKAMKGMNICRAVLDISATKPMMQVFSFVSAAALVGG
jgi:hypothetical protein